MKKTILLFLAALSFATLQAQWVDDPRTNTFLANCSSDAGEVYTSTDPVSGDTYVQWVQGASNGWAPNLQRVTFDGTPQWGADGIHITTPNLAAWSPGYAMTAVDGACVTVFRTADAHHFAVRVNADGSFPWGQDGIMLFDGMGGDRSEVMACEDGSVWATGTDYNYTYLQHINVDGTLDPLIVMGDGEHQYMFGLMVPTIGNGVLVAFEKETWAYTYYYEKEIWVVGYTPEGGQIAPEQQLMAPYTMAGSYCHYVVPDGQNGGYAYMWHSGIMGAFNTYVFHFDEYGNSTISDLNGIPVHSADPVNFYHSAYGTVDPVSHDLIIAYEQVDASTQSQSRIYMNRITSTGERLWGEGILVADYENLSYSNIMVDAYEDGTGFTVIYEKSSPANPYFTTVEAIGMDMDGNPVWSKTLSSSTYRRSMSENTPGFHLGQNVVAWVNCTDGGLYGQNIGPDGTMGPIEPVIPEPQCLAPENLDGGYYYDVETQTFGVQLTWEAPATEPLHYNLYRYDVSTKDNIVIEVDANATSYFDEAAFGEYKYQLTAVYEDCESDFALTPDGDDHVNVFVTSLGEQTEGEEFDVMRVYNANGQVLHVKNVNELSAGVYILQGLTQDGRWVSRKVVVNP